jgi:hypothetical protein
MGCHQGTVRALDVIARGRMQWEIGKHNRNPADPHLESPEEKIGKK